MVDANTTAVPPAVVSSSSNDVCEKFGINGILFQTQKEKAKQEIKPKAEESEGSRERKKRKSYDTITQQKQKYWNSVGSNSNTASATKTPSPYDESSPSSSSSESDKDAALFEECVETAIVCDNRERFPCSIPLRYVTRRAEMRWEWYDYRTGSMHRQPLIGGGCNSDLEQF